MAAGPHYITSERTAQETSLPTALLWLRACLLRPSREATEPLLRNGNVYRAVP
jgi:hypothetical protein